MNDFLIIKNPYELLDYMNKNIKYGFLGKNGKKYYDMYSDEWNDWFTQCYVQSAEEVLESKIGTCWDQVELERLWFEKNNYNLKTYFCWFEVNRENDLPTHTFLIYEKDGKWYWFEHSFENCRGIHEFNSEEETLEYVKEKQFEYTLNNNLNIRAEDKETLKFYEYGKPLDHLGVEDFISFVTSNKLISYK